jgi:hypothetical protein
LLTSKIADLASGNKISNDAHWNTDMEQYDTHENLVIKEWIQYVYNN